MIFGLLIDDSHVATNKKSPKTLELSRERMIVQRLASHATAK